MIKLVRNILITAIACISVLHWSQAYENTVTESARSIPIAYDVDVVVIGGSSAGVAAAVEASRNGARVFLAAPRPYLGEDLCGTYRLWLEPGEEPTSSLARKVFAQPPVAPRIGKGIPFRYYNVDKPSAGTHKDTVLPSLLTDGKWNDAAHDSVEYDDDVTITVDLPGEYHLQKVHVMAFQRKGDFEVESVIVSTSSDRQQWKRSAIIQSKTLGESLEGPAMVLSAPLAERARQVRFFIKKGPHAGRILLGEIVIEAAQSRAEAAKSPRLPPTPMQVKRTLDQALLDAGVPFLFGCYATDILRDAGGDVAGIVMANRSGRQAVKAKVIIDATPRGAVARMAGATFAPYPVGRHIFQHIVIGGTIRTGAGMRAREMPTLLQNTDASSHEVIEYTLSIPMKDGSFASFAEAQQVARDNTWHRGQVDASEVLFQVPPDPVHGKNSLSGAWLGAENVDLDVFRPAGVGRLYVLGGCADMPREATSKLLRPIALMDVGMRVGKAAATEAKSMPKAKDTRLVGKKSQPAATIEVREILTGVRPTQEGLPAVPSDERALPILGDYDVVVVGGGTGGAPAGIGAARQGVKTLVVEYLHGLGGVGTLGLIGEYWYGNRKGFTREIDTGVPNTLDNRGRPTRQWNIQWKMQWYRHQLRKAGADIWFGTLACGALVHDGRVQGVVVATPEGRGVVLAKVVIDATGNSDVAAAAGAQCTYTDGSCVAVQGTGLPPRQLGANISNTDYTFTDDTDVVDTWRTLVVAKKRFKAAYDLGQLVDTRERQRIVGEYVLSPVDIFNRRTFPDTLVLSRSDFDMHGFFTHPLFLLTTVHSRKVALAYTPYRCLLPKGLDGILVIGLGLSAHRDAMAMLRMQANIQNQGYAAGVAAAMTAKAGKGTRDIDIKALQRHLVETGNLPESVLTDKDSFPIPKEEVAAAVKSVVPEYEGVEVLLAQPQDALPLLQEAYETSDSEEAKLVYAHILATIGDNTGTRTLIEAIRSREWDSGRPFRVGRSKMSPLDSLIIALGCTGDERALDPILEKVKRLSPESEFYHHRAVAIALEEIGDPRAAKPLAELLRKPRMTGYAVVEIKAALARPTPPPSAYAWKNDTAGRGHSLRELILARALYRCGDYEGFGEKILGQYERDLRGHYSRHAHAVLGEKQENGNL